MRAVWVLTVAALVSAEPACAPVTSAEELPDPSVLFIGNSLTYSNDLRGMVARIAEAAGGSVRVAMVAGPNMAVIDHTGAGTDAETQIRDARWSFVVLHQGPTPPGICRDTLVLAAMRLAPAIRDAGGRPALVVPWSRQAFPRSLEFATESATAAARAVGGVVIPVGMAWRNASSADPSLPLYSPDGYHPAPAGTLLAALTAYDRLFGRDVRAISPAALSTIPGVSLTPAQIASLAAAAHAASTDLSADPRTPAPPDTTVRSAGGGPC